MSMNSGSVKPHWVHEVDDVGLGHRAGQRAVHVADLVLLEGRSLASHGGSSVSGLLAQVRAADFGVLAQLGGGARRARRCPVSST